MAQYDLLLTQNVHATLTEYSEKFVNMSKGGLLSAVSDQTPTVLAGGTDGYILARDDGETTGLIWIDPTTLGVSVANQANDRIVTATAAADALNAEANLTYNTTQGLYIGSGLGIVFAAAATTYSIYTPAGAVKSNITIETGSNSAAGAGDITIKAGAGVSAGGNVYFQRDTTYGNFYFGTGGAGQLPARAAETNVIYYDPATGKLSYGVSVAWGTATNEYVVLGSSAGDVSSSAQLAYNTTTHVLTIDSGAAASSKLELQYNSTTAIYVEAISATRADFVWPTASVIYFYPETGNNGHMAIGNYHDANTFFGVKDTNSAKSQWTFAAFDNANNIILGVQQVGIVYMTQVAIDNAEAYMLMIDATTGQVSRRAVSTLPTGGGDVSWGTETGLQPIVYGANAGDIDSANTLTYNPSNFTFTLDSLSAADSIFQVYYNSTIKIGLRANSFSGILSATGILYLTPTGVGSRIGIGDGADPDVFVYVKDSNASPLTSVFKVVDDAAASLFDVRQNGTMYIPGLGDDDTEDHVVAINDSTGLITKRSVASLGGGLWSRAVTTLSPDTATDHVQLGISANLQLGGATNTYITGASGGNINITVSGNAKMNFTPSVTVCYQAFSTNVTDTVDIGTATSWFRNVYAQRYYLDEIGTYVYSNAGVLTFVDGTTGSRTLADLATVGSGTVTAVNNGSGMDFTNITTSGTVTLGTPGTLTSATSNGVTASSHTHNITTGIASTNIVAVTGTVANNDYAKFNTTGLIGRTYAELAADIDASLFSFSAANTHTGAERFTGAGSLEFEDNCEIEMGSSADISIYFSGSHLFFDSVLGTTDIYFRQGTTTRFLFDISSGDGTAHDWIATSDIRAKTNITPFELDMDQFLVLGKRAIRHNWKEGWGPANTPEIGFVAQDIEQFFPELVKIGRDRPHMRGLSYGKLVTVAIKATAQTWEYAVAIDGKLGVVQSEVGKLKDRVKELEDKLNTIQNG